MTVALYMDVHVPQAITEQLRRLVDGVMIGMHFWVFRIHLDYMK